MMDNVYPSYCMIKGENMPDFSIGGVKCLVLTERITTPSVIIKKSSSTWYIPLFKGNDGDVVNDSATVYGYTLGKLKVGSYRAAISREILNSPPTITMMMIDGFRKYYAGNPHNDIFFDYSTAIISVDDVDNNAAYIKLTADTNTAGHGIYVYDPATTTAAPLKVADSLAGKLIPISRFTDPHHIELKVNYHVSGNTRDGWIKCTVIDEANATAEARGYVQCDYAVPRTEITIPDYGVGLFLGRSVTIRTILRDDEGILYYEHATTYVINSSGVSTPIADHTFTGSGGTRHYDASLVLDNSRLVYENGNRYLKLRCDLYATYGNSTTVIGRSEGDTVRISVPITSPSINNCKINANDGVIAIRMDVRNLDNDPLIISATSMYYVAQTSGSGQGSSATYTFVSNQKIENPRGAQEFSYTSYIPDSYCNKERRITTYNYDYIIDVRATAKFSGKSTTIRVFVNDGTSIENAPTITINSVTAGYPRNAYSATEVATYATVSASVSNATAVKYEVEKSWCAVKSANDSASRDYTKGTWYNIGSDNGVTPPLPSVKLTGPESMTWDDWYATATLKISAKNSAGVITTSSCPVNFDYITSIPLQITTIPTTPQLGSSFTVRVTVTPKLGYIYPMRIKLSMWKTGNTYSTIDIKTIPNSSVTYVDFTVTPTTENARTDNGAYNQGYSTNRQYYFEFAAFPVTSANTQNGTIVSKQVYVQGSSA